MIRESFDALMCDLDGVLYRGTEPIRGAARAIRELREQGIKVVFATNNSRPTLDDYISRLTDFDVPVTAGDIVTSGGVTAELLAQRGHSGDKALVRGGVGLRRTLEDVGIHIVDSAAQEPDLVVVGWDLDFNFDAMREAARAVLAGAVFIGTNEDAAWPAPEGLWPGTGAIIASIEVAAGRKAEIMGKPHKPMLDVVATRFGDHTKGAAVGDRPDTDLAGAHERGWTTILVLSGVTDASAAKSLDPQPDLIIDSLADLPAAVQ